MHAKKELTYEMPNKYQNHPYIFDFYWIGTLAVLYNCALCEAKYEVMKLTGLSNIIIINCWY